MVTPKRSSWRARRVIGAVALWALALLVARTGLADCSGDGPVGIDQIIRGVNIALGLTPADDCPAMDRNGDGQVSIDELVTAVAVALGRGGPRKLVSGQCDRPGNRQSSGTRTCEAGTVLRVARCDGDTCLHEARARTVLGSGAVVGAEGQFSVGIPEQDLQALFVVAAELREAGDVVFPYRNVQRNGSQGPEARRAVAATNGSLNPVEVFIDPSSEGTLKVVDQRGLENFTDAQIADLIDEVRGDGRAQYGGLSLQCAANLGAGIAASFISQIFQGSVLVGPSALAVDATGRVFVAGRDSDNVFRITPAGEVRQIIDGGGDRAGHVLSEPDALAVDTAGNVFVAGYDSDNVFRITPGGEIREIIDGGGYDLSLPDALAVDAAGNVFVAGSGSDNVFRITAGGEVQQIIDGTGDGAGHALEFPNALAVDAADNVFVAGRISDNVFRITPGGEIRQIIDETSDGSGHALGEADSLAVDAAGNVFVAGDFSNNVFRITPGGQIRQIIDATGDGAGHPLSFPEALAVDPTGNIFVAGSDNNVFRITPGGQIRQIIDEAGDRAGHELLTPSALAVDAAGNVSVASSDNNNVFRITPAGAIRLEATTCFELSPLPPPSTRSPVTP